MILGIVLGIPLVYCIVFFSTLGDGHPPGIVLPIAYVLFVTPFVAPVGAWFSVISFIRYPRVRRSASALIALFVVGTLVSWVWFIPFALKGSW